MDIGESILNEVKGVIPKSFHIMWMPATNGAIMSIDATATVNVGGITSSLLDDLLKRVAKDVKEAQEKGAKELKEAGFTVLDTGRVDPKYDVLLTQNKSRDMVIYAQGSILLSGGDWSEGSKDKAFKIVGNRLADAGYKFSKKLPLEEGKGTRFECQECGAKFSKKIGAKTTEVKCPKCGSYDTDLAYESRVLGGRVLDEARRETLMSYVDAVYLGWCNDMLKALKGELTHKPTEWKVGASRTGIGVDFVTTDKSDFEVKGHVFLLARSGRNFSSISAGITTDNAYTGRKSEDLTFEETMTFDQMVEELKRRLENMANL